MTSFGLLGGHHQVQQVLAVGDWYIQWNWAVRCWYLIIYACIAIYKEKTLWGPRLQSRMPQLKIIKMSAPHWVVTLLGLSFNSNLLTFLSSKMRHQIPKMNLRIPSDLTTSTLRINHLLSHIGKTLRCSS